MVTYEDLVTLFEDADRCFRHDDIRLFEDRVSERTLCGALMLHLHEGMRKHGELYKGFHADVEYNRNRNTIKKILQKKEDNDDGIIVNINCDLLVHGRGLTLEQENLIAIEMKKDYAQEVDKNRDRYAFILSRLSQNQHSVSPKRRIMPSSRMLSRLPFCVK